MMKMPLDQKNSGKNAIKQKKVMVKMSLGKTSNGKSTVNQKIGNGDEADKE